MLYLFYIRCARGASFWAGLLLKSYSIIFVLVTWAFLPSEYLKKWLLAILCLACIDGTGCFISYVKKRNFTKLIGCVMWCLKRISARWVSNEAASGNIWWTSIASREPRNSEQIWTAPSFSVDLDFHQSLTSLHKVSLRLCLLWSTLVSFQVSVCRRSHGLLWSHSLLQQCLFSGCSPTGFLSSVLLPIDSFSSFSLGHALRGRVFIKLPFAFIY